MPVLSSILKNIVPKKPPACTAVIAAAGISVRCEGEDKLFYTVNDKPVLAYTLEPFNACELVNEIIIVANKERIESIGQLCVQYGFDKVSKIMEGGSTRLESVMNGVYAVSGRSGLIAIHDGARPCIDIEIINETIKKAAVCHAAAPAAAIASTVKKVDGGVITETINREGLYEIQTPQVFRAEIIKGALSNAAKKSINVTDDCMAVEAIGVPVYITQGSRKNIKITDNRDFRIAEALLNEEFF
ncbi:MAG: 2-C-methyl-D-erythritol 4-phosphate cytidylyltransferase [Oscillospiraceae bacterium]|nr:2-C-methyl-D-erythritol 4-phosphate cytidylyltransferase [Oscillospiraceae bacterium]